MSANGQKTNGSQTTGLWSASGPGFSSTTDDWATPPAVFAALDREFAFTLDASASAANAKCRRYFDATVNGLAQCWAPETTWLNPPYGRTIGRWLEKAADEATRGATVVALVPARTDTRWWHEQVMARASEVRLVKGRLHFGDGSAPAPFPSAIVVFRPTAEALVFSAWTPPKPAAKSMTAKRRASVATCPASVAPPRKRRS